MANDLRARLEAKEFPTASPGILVDDAIAVFREWLESEAQVEPVARALGTLAGAKFDVFSELTGLPYDDWLAWSSEARAALKALASQLGEKDHG